MIPRPRKARIRTFAWAAVWTLVSLGTISACMAWQRITWLVLLFWLVTTVGLVMRWGWTVFGAVCGFFLAPFFTPTYSHGSLENVLYDLGYPLIGTMVGALVGAAIEAQGSKNRESPNATQPEVPPPIDHDR